MIRVTILVAITLLSACSQIEKSPSYSHSRDYLPIKISQTKDTIYYSSLGIYEPPDSLWCDIAQCIPLDKDRFVIELTEEKPLGSISLISKAKGKYVVPLHCTLKKQFTLKYPDNKKRIKEVFLKGEMTLWREEACTYNEESGHWEFEFEVLPGTYQYIFIIDGQEHIEPGNKSIVKSDIGTTNALFKYKIPSGNQVTQLEPKEQIDAGVRINYTGPKPEAVLALIDNQPVSVSMNEGYFDIEWDKQQKGNKSLRVWSSSNGVRSNDLNIPLRNATIIKKTEALPRTDTRAQIMYFVLIDRFNNGDTLNDRPVLDDRVHPSANYKGGDLAGVKKKIESGYFEDLGINAIWLSPVTQNPEEAYQEFPEPHRWYTGYHGYWPISSTAVDYRFGTNDDMTALVNAAHESGISVYLDYICNHIHEEHPVYKNNPDWATQLYLEDSTANIRIWEEQRLTTWFDDFLPTLDFSKKEVIDSQVDSAFYWLKEFGLDGYRHDATKHIPNEFWRSLTKRIVLEIVEKQRKPIFQIGETYGARELISSYIGSGLLDAQFDFPFYFDMRNILLEEDQPMSDLKNIIEQSLSNYGHHHSMGNITGNHDQPRFISLAGGGLSREENDREAGFSRKVGVGDNKGYDKLRLLQAINLAVPGIPVNYYGDEIGIPGANDPDSRRMMRFDGWTKEEAETYRVTRKLNRFRRQSMALTYGTTKVIYENKSTLVLERKYFNEVVFACFNKTKDSQTISLDNINLPAEGSIYNIKTTRNKIELPPYGFEYFKYEE